ncbi:MAG: glycosyltransferase, partial [Alphaproteobacteria bacterium]|nr:glycosyltransferase [Alphaproteobacteria bacterium]
MRDGRRAGVRGRARAIRHPRVPWAAGSRAVVAADCRSRHRRRGQPPTGGRPPARRRAGHRPRARGRAAGGSRNQRPDRGRTPAVPRSPARVARSRPRSTCASRGDLRDRRGRHEGVGGGRRNRYCRDRVVRRQRCATARAVAALGRRHLTDRHPLPRGGRDHHRQHEPRIDPSAADRTGSALGVHPDTRGARDRSPHSGAAARRAVRSRIFHGPHMTDLPMLHRLEAQLESLARDNRRLRTALAEANARAARSGHELLLSDGLPFVQEPLRCRRRAVQGRVTVIVPAYNAEEYLEGAVRSVWSQNVEPDRIELLVVDDGSTDGTRRVAERLCAESPVRMRVLQHPYGCNRGVAPTRQRAAAEATGEFVALLDADDRFLADRLAATVAVLESDASPAAVCSLGRNVDSDGALILGHNGTEQAGDWRTLGADFKPPFTFDQLWRADPIANSSLTVRREALEQVGGFPALMGHQAEDWLLVLKLSTLSPIPCLDRELIDYTHHPGAYTQAYHAQGLREGARLEVFYHLAWWMLSAPERAEAGATFFRREYPRLVADHHRLLPLVRECYDAGVRPAAGALALGEHLQRLTRELESLRT